MVIYTGTGNEIAWTDGREQERRHKRKEEGGPVGEDHPMGPCDVTGPRTPARTSLRCDLEAQGKTSSL